jgi:prevent-host-death family protein
MRAVGVRELKERTGEIVRRVREGRETIAVTYRGKVVARLVPADEPAVSQDELARLWADIDQLAAEISARWPAGVSAVDAINDVRRDL